MSKINSLAPWYGAKRAMAGAILPHLGEHTAYCEPFCGSLAVLLSKPPVRSETANDLHGDLLNLARVVQDEALCGRLHWRMSRTLMHEGLYREAVAELRASDCPSGAGDPDRAAAYMVRSWMGMNGVAGTDSTTSFARRYSAGGGDPAVRFRSAVDSLPWWHERLRRVCLYQMDAFELLARLGDDAKTTIYCDPPYLEKSTKYRHDFASGDHERLAAALRRFAQARVVVSYYAHPDLAALYPGWRVVPLTRRKLMRNPNAAAPSGDAPEVLLVNQPE